MVASGSIGRAVDAEKGAGGAGGTHIILHEVPIDTLGAGHVRKTDTAPHENLGTTLTSHVEGTCDQEVLVVARCAEVSIGAGGTGGRTVHTLHIIYVVLVAGAT